MPKARAMQARSQTASAGYGTGHIESNECIGTSPVFQPVFRASTPCHIQEPSVPTKIGHSAEAGDGHAVEYYLTASNRYQAPPVVVRSTAVYELSLLTLTCN